MVGWSSQTSKAFRTCKCCGWIAFGISEADANKAVEAFNKVFNTLTSFEQEEFYASKPASIRNYCHCIRCGCCFRNFRPYDKTQDTDVAGHTLNPILDPEAKNGPKSKVKKTVKATSQLGHRLKTGSASFGMGCSRKP